MNDPLLDAEPATPRPSPWPKAVAGAVLVLGGLGLVVCGGTFLIGAMFLVQPQFANPGVIPVPLSPEGGTLLMTLYALAAACFVGAVLLFVFAVRGLLRVFGDRGEPQ